MARALLIVFDSLRKDVFDRCHHPLLETWRDIGTTVEHCHSQSGFTPISFSSFLSGKFPSNNAVKSTGPLKVLDHELLRGFPNVWWNVERSETANVNLVLPGSCPMIKSAFSLFSERFLTLAFEKTNAFAELREEEMMESPEFGSDLETFYRRITEVNAIDDSLVVIRVYDTHMPYGRSVSICDAGSTKEIKKQIAKIYRKDRGKTLLEEVAVASLNRALDYLLPLWDAVSVGLDFAAVMSDHGDFWSGDDQQIGHAPFLNSEVLRTPLIVIDGINQGTCFQPCNNVDVIATLLKVCGKTPDWPMDGIQLSLGSGKNLSRSFITEANSSAGRWLNSRTYSTVD